MALPPGLAAIMAEDEGLTPTEYAIKRKGQTYLQKIDENTRPIQGVMRTGKEVLHKVMDVGGRVVRESLGAPYGIDGEDPVKFAEAMRAKAKEFEGGTDPIDALANRWAGFIPRNVTRVGDIGEQVIGRGLNVVGAAGDNLTSKLGAVSAAATGDLETAAKRLGKDPGIGGIGLAAFKPVEDSPEVRGFAVGLATDPLSWIPAGAGEKALQGLSKVRGKLPGALTPAQKAADDARLMAHRRARAGANLESSLAQEDAVEIFKQAQEAGISRDRLEEIVRYYFDPNDRIRIYGKPDPVTGAPRLRGKKALARAIDAQGGGVLLPYMGPLTPAQADYEKAIQKARSVLANRPPAQRGELPLLGRLNEEEQAFADSLEGWFAKRRQNILDSGVPLDEAANKISGKYIHRSFTEKPEVDLVKKLQILNIRNNPGKQGIQIERKANVPLGSKKAEELGGRFDPADIVDSYDWQANRLTTLQKATEYLRQQSVDGKLDPRDLTWLRDRYGSSKFQDFMNVALRETGNEAGDMVLGKIRTGVGKSLQAYATFLDKMNANVLQKNPAHHISNHLSDAQLVWQAGHDPLHVASEGTDLLKMGHSARIFQEAINDGLDVVNAGRSELLRTHGRLAEKLRYSGGYGFNTQDAFDKVLSKIHDKTGIALPLQKEVSENWDAALKLGLYKVLKYEKGMSGADAVREVFRILPEYGNDTHLFRAVKAVIPFLTWQVQMAKKVPRNMIRNPGRAALQARIQEAMAPEDQAPLTWRENHSFVAMPDEMKQIYDTLARAIGANPKAGELILRTYMPSEALAPVFDLGEGGVSLIRAGLAPVRKIAPRSWGWGGPPGVDISQAGAFKSAALGVLNRTNPLVRGIGESIVGLDAFDQRPLDQVPGVPDIISNTASEVIPSLIPNTPLASAAINYAGKKVTGYDRIVGGIRKDLRSDPANQLTDALISGILGARVKTTDRQRAAQNALILRRRHYPEKSK